MNELCPSILAADFNILGQQLDSLEKAGIRWLHIDVMDGAFVPEISFGMPVIHSIRRHKNLFFDTHLMIQNPVRYVESFHRAGADSLTFHVEAEGNPAETIRKIRECGMKVGMSIKPATPPEALLPYLGELDLVLVMTVEPGWGGQAYLPESTEKIARMAELLAQSGSKAVLQVDGGMKEETCPLAMKAGATHIVAGSWVFRENLEENARRISELVRTFGA